VAHELNNPLTAILGYSQLLLSSGQMPAQGMEYSDKLYKQAQRTSQSPEPLSLPPTQAERIAVHSTRYCRTRWRLRDYDLRLSNVRVHYDLAPDLPMTARTLTASAGISESGEQRGGCDPGILERW